MGGWRGRWRHILAVVGQGSVSDMTAWLLIFVHGGFWL